MIDITLSREEIRKQLIQYYANILEIDEQQLDTSDASFSSFVINALSALASNVLVYGSLIYNESSLVTAQLPESIVNWARYLDYSPKVATASNVDILIKIPLTGKYKTYIKSDHKFYANNTIFIPKYDYEIDLLNGIKIYRVTDVAIPIPFSTVDENNQTYLVFTIPVYQQYTIIEEFSVPQLRAYEFFSQTIQLTDGYVIDVKVEVDGEFWDKRQIVFADPNEKVFEWVVLNDKLKIMFGNDLVGKQPQGIVKVHITLTNGEDGNVGPGTINKGDPLYSDEQPPQRIDYSVVNIVGATGGSNFEALLDIKRNAPRSLSILKRVVSYTDYFNIFKIIYGEDNISLPLLKRSDLSINDVHIYTVLKWNEEIVPTTTIYFDYDETVDSYNMYTVFTHDNLEWVCPFLLEVDHDKQIVNYRYIPEEMPLNIYSATIANNSSITLVSGKVTYDYITDNYTLIFNVVSLDPTVNVTQDISIRFTNTWIDYTPTNVQTPIQGLYVFEYTIPRSQIKGLKSIDIRSYQDGTMVLLDTTTFHEVSLDHVSLSHIYTFEDGSKKIIDVPVILKSFYDTLTDDDKKAFTFYMVSRFLTYESNLQNRMMNVHINLKLAKTYGKLNNIQHSTPDYIVKEIVHSVNDITNPQLRDMYAVSDPIDPQDAWYQYAGYLAVWGGSDWTFFKPGRGTIIRNSSDGNIYSTDGRRWFIPDYNNPLSIEVEVYTTSYGGNIYNEVLDTILSYINNEIAIEESIFLSQLTDLLHNIPGVDWVRIITPSSDIIYRDTYDNLTKDQLATYVPEYVLTDADHIKITLSIARR